MKFIPLLLLILVLIGTPALTVFGKDEDKSSNGQGQGNSQSNQENKDSNQGKSDTNSGPEKKEEKAAEKNEQKTIEKVKASSNPSNKLNARSGSTATDSGKALCDPNYPWKNHGEYVSCVAKLKLGGQSVSDAAKSDIGKKNETGTPSASVSPTASGSAMPSFSPTPEATSAGIISSITKNLESVQETVSSITDQFSALLELLNPFD